MKCFMRKSFCDKRISLQKVLVTKKILVSWKIFSDGLLLIEPVTKFGLLVTKNFITKGQIFCCDDQFIFILSGLNPTFAGFVFINNFVIKDTLMPLTEFEFQLLSYEEVQQGLNQSINVAAPQALFTHNNENSICGSSKKQNKGKYKQNNKKVKLISTLLISHTHARFVVIPTTLLLAPKLFLSRSTSSWVVVCLGC